MWEQTDGDKISVIVPAYNEEKNIRRCIDSILNQTYKHFEIIITDDGASDSSGEICDDYAVKQANIVVIHRRNSGLSEARNAGLDWCFGNSDSRWIAFIDSDDFISEEYFEILISACIKTHTVIADSDIFRIEASSFENGVSRCKKEKCRAEGTELRRPADIWVEHCPVAWGRLMIKSLWKGIRFPAGKYHEDEFTMHKILFQVEHICIAHDAVYFYIQNPKSIMHSGNRLEKISDLVEAVAQQAVFLNERQPSLYEDTLKRYIHLLGCAAYYHDKEKGSRSNKFRALLKQELKKNNHILRAMSDASLIFRTAYPVKGRIYINICKLLHGFTGR